MLSENADKQDELTHKPEVKFTVIGVIADFCCCSNAPMMASMDSSNRPVTSALEYIISDDQA